MNPDQRLQAAHAKLKELRERQDLTLKPTPLLKGTFTDFDGEEKPLKIRYYQVQAILHLVAMRRFLLGDDCGLGKTICCIGALCYVWAMDPETKVVVLTNKSTVKQWAFEFTKFCTPGEITVITCTGSPAQRQKIYKTFEASTGPTVLIMGYATARRDVKQIQDWTGHILVTDECFQYHTPILLADGTQELIGRLVTRKTPAEVLSWNAETGEIEPRRIVGWYRKPMPGIHGRSPSKRTAAMLKLEFRWGGNLLSTPDHEFYRMDGTKVRARDLGSGDRIAHFDRNIPSPDQMQVLLGGLLGDSSVSHPRKTWAVAFGHGTAQKAYLEFKRDVLMSLGVSEVTETRSGYARSKKIWRFRMKANEEFTRVAQDDCDLLVPYSGPRADRRYRKRITHEWLNRIGPLGLAIWYADDGSLTQYRRKDGSKGYQVRISTDDFTQSEAGMLAGWLYWVWGIKAEPKIEYRKSGGKRKRRRLPYPHLFLGDEAARSFFELLPGAFPGVQAKFPDGMRVLRPQDLDLLSQTQLRDDRLVRRSRWKTTKPAEQYVYDLEVEGNHNYFANGTLVSNCSAYKNPSTQTYQVVRHIGHPERAVRHWGLSATLIKNNLIEGFGIYSLLVPGLFPTSKNRFMNEYCLTRLQPIPGSRRQIPIIIGYRKDQIARFREKIDPYFLSRAKFDVARELPVLTVRNYEVGMTSEQHAKYREALSGLLEVDKTGEERETTKLTSLIYCQEIVDHPELVDCEGDSEKMDALFSLLTAGDFADEKVIVFSRFRKMVDKLEKEARSKRYNLNTVRVTGNEDEDERQEAMRRFQDPNDEARVCWITTAAREGVNLQAAKAVVFYDSPWSAGDYLQVLGRMIRIGSKHDRCYAVHMVAKGTIDGHVLTVLRKKMKLIEQVMGKRLKGDDMKDLVVAEQDSIDDLFTALQADARKYA